MNPENEWFSPEHVEEQIERHLHSPDPSANTHLLHDLQHLATDDARQLATIRARLLSQVGQPAHPPASPLVSQPAYAQSSRQPQRPRTPNPWLFPIKLASGLAALLLIATMLFTLARLGIRLGQSKLHQPTPITTTHLADPHGRTAFLLDATSGKALVDLNAHARRPIANMPILMTAVVAIEDGNLDQYVTVDQTTLNAVPKGGRTAGLQAGDRLPLRDLLYGLVFLSADDSALVIAQAVGGSPPQFVSLMNDEAHQLQLADTYFAAPYASSSSYSSATDLVALANYALQLSNFSQILQAQEHTLAPTSDHHSYQWRTTNTLQFADPHVQSILLGYDSSSGVCIVFSAQKNNHLLLGAELHATSARLLAPDISNLLQQGNS